MLLIPVGIVRSPIYLLPFAHFNILTETCILRRYLLKSGLVHALDDCSTNSSLYVHSNMSRPFSSVLIVSLFPMFRLWELLGKSSKSAINSLSDVEYAGKPE